MFSYMRCFDMAFTLISKMSPLSLDTAFSLRIDPIASKQLIPFLIKAEAMGTNCMYYAGLHGSSTHISNQIEKTTVMEVISIEKGKIQIEDNGPYRISGDVQLIDDAGNVYETKGSIDLCRCGRSHEKPFCDGTHEDVHFDSAP